MNFISDNVRPLRWILIKLLIDTLNLVIHQVDVATWSRNRASSIGPNEATSFDGLLLFSVTWNRCPRCPPDDVLSNIKGVGLNSNESLSHGM